MSPHSWQKNKGSPKLAGIPDLGRAVDTGALILRRRGWESPVSSASALYVFLGILITLVISAPLLALLRSRQRHALREHTRALEKAEGNVQELTSLRNIRQTLTEEQQQHRKSRQDYETLLQEEREELMRTILQVDELERNQQEMGATMAAISNARMMECAERDDAQGKLELALEDVRNLEEQIRVKDGNLAVMQRKYEFVNQEYLGLLHTTPSNIV